MKGVIRYFYNYPFNADALMLLVILFGAFAMRNTKSTFFPVVPSKIIMIQTVYPGASPEEMEEGIVIKIEDNLKGVVGIDQIKTVCTENSAIITVEATNAKVSDKVLQDVKNAVDRIASFPVGMEPPIIYKRDQIDFALSFAISGEGLSLYDLKRYGRLVEAELRAIEGISQIQLDGFPEEEIEIEILEDKLRALNLNFNEVSAAISAANIESTGGKVRGSHEEFLIRGRFKEYRAQDLADVVIRATPDGRVIRLGDVARLSDRWAADNPSRSSFNGNMAVIVTMNSLAEEDFLTVTEQTKAYINKFNAEQDVVTLSLMNDRSVTLNQRIELLRDNGILGFILVVILLALFLNVRLAFWVALAIPASFGGMFIIGQMLGITINVISLFGMILVVGILVDDGIVIAENIYSKYEEGMSRRQATIEGTMEVFGAVFSAIATTVIAFSMFFFIEGRLGDIFGQMALVVILTLVFSLVEGALILPAHVGHSKALSKNNQPTKIESVMRRFMEFLKMRMYAPSLRFTMRYPIFVFSVVLSMLVFAAVGGVGGGFVRTTFFPNLEADNISVTLKMTAGTRDRFTQQALDFIEAQAWELNKDLKAARKDGLDVVKSVNITLGPTSYDGKMDIILLDSERRNMSVEDVTRKLREKVGNIYGVEQLIFGSFSPFGRPVAVSLLGNDLHELNGALQSLKDSLRTLPELKDVTDNNQLGLNEINIQLTDKALHLGVRVQDIMGQLRQGFFGQEAQRLQRGIDEVRVWVRLDESDRSSLDRLRSIRIRTADGGSYPLEELATFDVKRGIAVINHLNGSREMQVSADLADRKASAADVNARVRNQIVPVVLAKFPTVRASYEGQNREVALSQKSAARVLPIILLLMLVVIVLTFRSVWQAVFVMLIIPFGFIGVILGHYVHDVQISLFSILGLIALVGVLVNDAIVFVSAFNTKLKQGLVFKEALYTAALSRFRPILLTSITTIAGLAPLILEKSFQAQFLVPMAVSIAYGLLFTTMVILIVLPIYLLFLNGMRVYIKWFWVGVRPTPEEVEPAVYQLKIKEE